MILLASVTFGWSIASTLATIILWRARCRTYDYAVKAAEHYGADDLVDPASCAYSDMATVIALDGNATPRWLLRSEREET